MVPRTYCGGSVNTLVCKNVWCAWGKAFKPSRAVILLLLEYVNSSNLFKRAPTLSQVKRENLSLSSFHIFLDQRVCGWGGLGSLGHSSQNQKKIHIIVRRLRAVMPHAAALLSHSRIVLGTLTVRFIHTLSLGHTSSALACPCICICPTHSTSKSRTCLCLSESTQARASWDRHRPVCSLIN